MNKSVFKSIFLLVVISFMVFNVSLIYQNIEFQKETESSFIKIADLIEDQIIITKQLQEKQAEIDELKNILLVQKNYQYDEIIESASKTYNVHPALIKAMIRTESDYNPDAVSRKGAGGLMQLMPATAVELGAGNRYDPVQNIYAGTKYLAEQFERFGTIEKSLWAYNAGPGNVKKGIKPKETIKYIDDVLRRFQALIKPA